MNWGPRAKRLWPHIANCWLRPLIRIPMKVIPTALLGLLRHKQCGLFAPHPIFTMRLWPRLNSEATRTLSLRLPGAMAGAVYGIQGIPVRWTTHVHGYLTLPNGEKKHYRTQDLLNVARCLLGLGNARMSRPDTKFPAKEVHEAGVLAASLEGAADVDTSVAVVSLCSGCRSFRQPLPSSFGVSSRRAAHVQPELAFCSSRRRRRGECVPSRKVRKVVVHCHGGRSRTALVLKAWYMQHENRTHDEAHRVAL
jgi:hypothetical protein